MGLEAATKALLDAGKLPSCEQWQIFVGIDTHLQVSLTIQSRQRLSDIAMGTLLVVRCVYDLFRTSRYPLTAAKLAFIV